MESHLQYMDETLVLVDDSWVGLGNLKMMRRFFGMEFGLAVN